MTDKNKDAELLEQIEASEKIKAENERLLLELENAKAENENLVSQVIELGVVKSENAKLAEQVEALTATNKIIEAKSQELAANQAQLATAQSELEELKAKITSSRIENALSEGLSALVFDVNSDKRNQALRDTVKAEWSKQYKAIEKEGVLIAYDKKTQTETTQTVAESVASFAKDNGYVIEKQQGFGLEVKKSASYQNITYEDAKSNDPERVKAYQEKKQEIVKSMQAKGVLIGSKKYFEWMEAENMLPPKESK